MYEHRVYGHEFESLQCDALSHALHLDLSQGNAFERCDEEIRKDFRILNTTLVKKGSYY